MRHDVVGEFSRALHGNRTVVVAGVADPSTRRRYVALAIVVEVGDVDVGGIGIPVAAVPLVREGLVYASQGVPSCREVVGRWDTGRGFAIEVSYGQDRFTGRPAVFFSRFRDNDGRHLGKSIAIADLRGLDAALTWLANQAVAA